MNDEENAESSHVRQRLSRGGGGVGRAERKFTFGSVLNHLIASKSTYPSEMRKERKRSFSPHSGSAVLRRTRDPEDPDAENC